MRTVLFLFLFVFLGWGLAGCDGSVTGTVDGNVDACPTDLDTYAAEVFAPTCGTGGCHGVDAPIVDLDLVSPGIVERLASAESLVCPGERLLVRGDPAASLLYRKVADATPTCGARMPVDGEPLTAPQLACLHAVIEALPGSNPDSDGGTVGDAGVCAGDLESCGGTCVDTTTHTNHCGGCDSPCTLGLSCVAGVCICAADRDVCGDACVDLQSDASHCGGCGAPCAAGQRCTDGACVACAVSATLSGDVQPIFDRSCNSNTCHGGARGAGDLPLERGRAYDALVNAPASRCNDGRLRVVPGRPELSYLIDKLEGHNLCAGGQMPLRAPALSTSEIAIVQGWICAEALDN
jgi:hypothetical protein